MEGGSELPGVGHRLRNALALSPKLKVLIAHGYFDLATPYFGSKYVVERLELNQTIFPMFSFASIRADTCSTPTRVRVATRGCIA